MSFKKQHTSVTVSEVRELTAGLAELLAVGMSMDSILGNVIGRTKNNQMSNVLKEVRQDVLAGHPLSVAMAKHYTVFDRNYVEMIRSGELNGSLDVHLAKYLSPPDLSATGMAGIR